MITLTLEIQPTDAGDEVSWRWFLFRKLLSPSPIEKRLRLIVQLTDAVSAALTVRSASEAWLKLFEKSYRELGPKPLFANYDDTL
jgi:hypothetical protein